MSTKTTHSNQPALYARVGVFAVEGVAAVPLQGVITCNCSEGKEVKYKEAIG